jgi:hypothetical protein
LASRSRIRKRKRDGCAWIFQAGWRACWVTKAPVGLTVQPAKWTRPLPNSMKKRTAPPETLSTATLAFLQFGGDPMLIRAAAQIRADREAGGSERR